MRVGKIPAFRLAHMYSSRQLPARRGAPVSWQRVNDDGALHGFRLDAGRDWRLASACGRGPARGVFVDPQAPLCEECRAILERAAAGPEAQEPPPPEPERTPLRQRSTPRPDIAALLDATRQSGATIEQLDDDHVRVLYDASNREQWIAIDDLSDAVAGHAALEGDGMFESAPNNWVVVHFDDATCGESRAPSGG